MLFIFIHFAKMKNENFISRYYTLEILPQQPHLELCLASPIRKVGLVSMKEIYGSTKWICSRNWVNLKCGK